MRLKQQGPGAYNAILMFSSLWSRVRNYRGVGALGLGSLETSVMERAWALGQCTVRELHAEYRGKLAYTTLMTTLDRLHKKGLLDRHKNGKAFVYRPKLSRDELDQTVVREVIGALVRDGNGERLPILSCFVDAISEEDEQLLAALEKEIKKRRKGGKGAQK